MTKIYAYTAAYASYFERSTMCLNFAGDYAGVETIVIDLSAVPDTDSTIIQVLQEKLSCFELLTRDRTLILIVNIVGQGPCAALVSAVQEKNKRLLYEMSVFTYVETARKTQRRQLPE